jgi:uncharacterized membrane protein YphA (DoxX/SURF4 family)
MLSLFPSLLSWQQLAPFIIRVTVGLVFVYWAYKVFRTQNSSTSSKIIASFEAIAGVLMIIGLWAQAAAIYSVIDLIVRLADRIQKKAFLTDGINYYVLLLVMTISIIVTGAGIWAFDMPL